MMERWQRIQTLFGELVDLESPTERERALDERTADAPDVRADVRALLDADARSDTRFDATAGDAFGDERTDRATHEALIGRTFGSYRIDEHLASGGMAHVYRGIRRSDGIDRRVAIKVLAARADGAELVARFRRERTTLARLEHDRIVSFLDADALPDGTPFLVMEHVDGEHLTTWVERHAPSRRTCVELMLQVLDAVDHAHSHLVVHRDLKPGNVLVTASGSVKLLDFGVAGALSERDLDGATPWTPGYASPQQMRGTAPTTADDVYSLGVLLGEVLSRAHHDDDPDLTAIVRRATADDPTDRYTSIAAFVSDLERHLAGDPVSARGSGLWYRLSCHARRDRWTIAFVASTLVALSIGWLLSDLARREARAEESIGWSAHAQARYVANHLESILLDRAATSPDRIPSLVSALDSALEDALRRDVHGEAEALIRRLRARLHLQSGDVARAREDVERLSELIRTTRGLGYRDRESVAELVREIGALEDG